MSVVAVVFESRFGQTKAIAERVADLAAARGHVVRLKHAEDAGAPDLEGADAVVLLAPVYDRKHADSIRALATAHRSRLARRPTAFFSVSLAAAIPRGLLGRRAAQKLVRDFLEETGLSPVAVATFGGALNYPAYPRGFRAGMRLAALALRLPTDTSRVHALTDWAEVERETHAFLAAVESARARRAAAGAAPPSSGRGAPARPNGGGAPASTR